VNNATEQIIEQLIRKHGLSKVRQAMSEQIGSANWSDWQRVNSWIKNTANKIERQNNETR
jgi:N-methylhydantoinase B/oxoprolinase/acetone carboxylase alpha subunit